MVHAGCVFVAGIHPSRTWTSGSFESAWWNACVHRPDLGLYSHPEEFFGGNGVWTHVNSKGKIPSTGKFPQRRIEPVTLWTASPNTTNELLWPPPLTHTSGTTSLGLYTQLDRVHNLPNKPYIASYIPPKIINYNTDQTVLPISHSIPNVSICFTR